MVTSTSGVTSTWVPPTSGVLMTWDRSAEVTSGVVTSCLGYGNMITNM